MECEVARVVSHWNRFEHDQMFSARTYKSSISVGLKERRLTHALEAGNSYRASTYLVDSLLEAAEYTLSGHHRVLGSHLE